MYLKVSEDDVDSLELAISVACLERSEERKEFELPEVVDAESLEVPSYFRADDGSLVLSFDGGWYPFLCNTRGYNIGPERWYVPKVSPLIAKIALELQSPAQRRFAFRPGGRVFLDAAGVRRRPAGYGDVEVMKWDLPRESPLLPERRGGPSRP